MKYLRKIVGLLIVVILLASIIIGIGVILAVKNVNITLESYTYSDWAELRDDDEIAAAAAEIDEFRQVVLARYRGTMINFVSDEDIAQCFEGSGYIFESCQRQYPCTLNIVLKERRETFVVSEGGDSYRTYDSLGEYLPNDSNYLNNLDGAPNILLIGIENDDDVRLVAGISQTFAKTFSALRSIVESIELQKARQNLIFTLRCGKDKNTHLEIHIDEYLELTEEKIQASYRVFNSLSGEEKLSGIILATDTLDGTVNAVRFPEGVLENSGKAR